MLSDSTRAGRPMAGSVVDDAILVCRRVLVGVENLYDREIPVFLKAEDE